MSASNAGSIKLCASAESSCITYEQRFVSVLMCAWSRFNSISGIIYCGGLSSRHNNRDECILFPKRQKSAQHKLHLVTLGAYTCIRLCRRRRLQFFADPNDSNYICGAMPDRTCLLFSLRIRQKSQNEEGRKREYTTLSNPKVTIIICAIQCTEYEAVVFILFSSYFIRKLQL